MALSKWLRGTILSPEIIADFEKKYGYKIPSDLKECIIINNGGRPIPDTIKLNNGEEFDVKSLLSFNKNDPENIYKVIDYFKNNYDGELMPFAADSGGNYYCIKNNNVILWTQDNEIFAVSESFSDFLAKLF